MNSARPFSDSSGFVNSGSLEQRRRFVLARSRRGSVIGMMAVLLPVLAILAVFAINIAHIQVTRTELMVATDAAARAGGRAYSETQDVNEAKEFALNTAAMNLVDGEPLLVRFDDGANEMEFGKALQQNGDDSRFVFEKIPTSDVISGAEIASAFRIQGRRDAASLSGRVPLIIPGVLSRNDFGTIQDTTVLQVDRDIALVLDRSGSMNELDISFPSGSPPFTTATLDAGIPAGIIRVDPWGRYRYTSGNDAVTFQQFVYEFFYELGEPPTTPFQDLVIAVDAFLNILDTTPQEEQVSVSSYSTNATLDAYLQKDFSAVRSTIDSLRPSGRTAIGLGMNEGINTLTDSAARPFAAKTMVVMTDGIHNQGIDPLAVAQNLVNSSNLVIHTVTFGSGADQQRMQSVAQVGGGNHYHASSGAELVSIFEEIANNLPTIITE